MKSDIKLETDAPSGRDGNRSILAGLLILIALVATVFFGVVGKDKSLLLSPLAIMGYLILAVWMLKAAVSAHPASVSPPGFYLFLLFICYGTLLVGTSAIPYETKLRMLELGLYVGAYYVWANSLALFRRSRAVLGWLMLFALLLCFYGLVNHFKNPEMVLWVERHAPYPGRLASTYICPNHFAHQLQMLLPFCLVFILIPRTGWLLRILAAYCILIFIPTLYFTESRAGILGSIAALGVTACLLALRKSKKMFLMMIVLVPLLSGILLVGAWNYSEMFKRRMTPVVEFLSAFQEEGFSNSKISDFRPLTWLDTVDMIKERPLTGFGPGSYRYLFPEHRKRFTGNRIVTGHPHNEYLEVASEYGLVGFGLLALAWGYGLLRLLIFSLKTPHQHHAFMAMAFIGTAAGTLLHSFFDFQMYVFQNALVFSLLAAIAVGPMCGRRQETLLEQGHAGVRGKLLHPARKITLALLATTGFLLSLQLFSSAFIRAAAARLDEEQKPEIAKRYYRQAIKMDATNWRAYKGIGAVYFKERYYTLDQDEKRRLARIEMDLLASGYLHNPHDAALVFDYGMATVFLGDKAAGIALLEEAARLRPFNDMYWLRLGVEQRKAERYDEAMKSFKYALSLRYSPMAKKNIEWLEHRKVAKPEPETRAVFIPKPVLIDTTEAPSPKKKESLDKLLQLLESQ